MKNKLYTRYFFAGIITLSLFSFAYVNVHAAYSGQVNCCEKTLKADQQVLVDDENKDEHNIPLPDVTILSRVVDVIQKINRSNH